MKKPPAPLDPGLAQIADLEQRIVRAHDEKETLQGVDPAELARTRPAVVALAAAVAARLRAEHLGRQR
jgi:hypothetical protein